MNKNDSGPSSTSGRLADAVLSFSVYLLPLVTAHVIWFVGGYLIQSIGRPSRSPQWMLLEWMVVLAAQLALFLVLRLTRRGPRLLRWPVLLGALVLLTPALNMILLRALPVRYLTEDSTEPATNALTEACRADGLNLLPAVATVFPSDDTAFLFASFTGSLRLAAIEVPGCQVRPLDIPETSNVVSTSPAGAVLWTSRDAANLPANEWFLTTVDGRTRQIDGALVPRNASPKLLDDGQTLAWIEGGEPPRIAVYGSGEPVAIALDGVARSSVELVGGSGAAGPFLVSVRAAGPARWLTIDANGRTIDSMEAPEMLSRFSHRVHPAPAGWVGWDTYVEDRRYVLAWSRDGVITRRELPRGLAFTSVAMDARGEYVAVSATSGLNIGSQQDEVWLVRIADGVELFRRYAPKYSRATVALPTGRFFAVDEYADGRGLVRVYALPGP